MADNEHVPGTMDVTAQKSTYEGVMGFASQWGVAICLGLTAFFTSLLIGAGFYAILVLAGVIIAVHLIAKTFFSH